MSDKKPLKIDEGRIKEFRLEDELPNQIDIEEIKEILSELITELIEIGIPLQNERLLKLLKQNYGS